MQARQEHELTRDDGAPAHARAIVRTSLAGHARVDDAELIVSELVTNALRHGAAPLHLTIDLDEGAVRIAVRQGRTALRPAPRAADPLRPGGQGLRIVAALADSWGWDEADGAITVWARL